MKEVSDKTTVNGIKAKIRKRRRAKGMSREDMAEQMHQHLNAYARWENANDLNRLCLQDFLRIADILGVPPTYLLPQSDATRAALREAEQLTDFLKGLSSPLAEHVEKLEIRLKNYS